MLSKQNFQENKIELYVEFITKRSVQVLSDFNLEKGQDGRWVGGSCRGINSPGISSVHSGSWGEIGSALLCIFGSWFWIEVNLCDCADCVVKCIWKRKLCGPLMR